MKILLDHNTPHGLRNAITDYDVQTAEFLGRETLRNGDPIRNAVQYGYALLITCDQSIQFQQNLLRQPIALFTNRSNISLVTNAVKMAQQGENNILRLRPPA